MGLFKPAWMSEKEESALRAVEKETNQNRLSKIVKDAPLLDVRCAAARKMTDQAMLAKIAVDNEDEYVRRAAVEKLTDQSLIEHIALNERHSYVREMAIEQLTKYDTLVSLIAKHLPKFNGYRAFSGNNDTTAPKVLAKIMRMKFSLNQKKDALDMFIKTNHLFSVIKVEVPESLYADLGISITSERSYTVEGHYFDTVFYEYKGHKGN